VVVEEPDTIKAGGPVMVVACSRQKRDTDPDSVQLPDRSTQPQTKSGLPKPCWAIPRWRFPVEQHRLNDYKGYLTGTTFRRVLAAYLARVEAESPDEGN
jgi:hypothetical protein